jgi:POT family proton-dependent oligopeptide transporter
MNLDVLLIIIGAIFSAIMISVAYVINHKEQPKQIWMLFFTEMWERFSFYGMRALLILYMTHVLLFPDKDANLQYGAYNALVYTMPLLGGWLADRLLGFRKSIVLGGVLMAIGHLVLAIPSQATFFLGLGFLISGNGFFKPNISSLLGRFYTEQDPRKDAGYSIFYMGVNIGAFLGGAICGYLGTQVNWHLGFGIAGIFMVLGLVVFLAYQPILGEEGLCLWSGHYIPVHFCWCR